MPAVGAFRCSSLVRSSVLKDRDYYLVERDGTISALRKPAAGGLEVELAVPPAVDKAVMDEPKQRVDLVLNWTKPDTLPSTFWS